MSTFLTAAVIVFVLLAFFGCSSDDPSAPEAGVGTIEIRMPAGADGASWHLYGPGDSFRHGDTDVVLGEMPSGRYTIIWTAVKDWTGPMPAKHTLAANGTLTLFGEYLDKAPLTSFVRIEGADFIMGSDNGNRKYWEYRDTTITRIIEGNEVEIDTTVIDTLSYPSEIGRDIDELRHRVQLTYTHFMSKTEITNQEFVELGNWAIEEGHATTTESSMLDALDGSTVELINFDFEDTPIDVQEGVLRLKKPGDALRPLIEVTWYGAASYCDWLSLKEGLPKAYDHNDWTLVSSKYRLPTEAEWENACRAGTQTAFYSGDIENGNCKEPSLDGAGWYCGNAGNSSHDVGTKAANDLGLFDMHGNVWEWCHSFYGPYEVPELPEDIFYEDEDLTPVVDPVGPEVGENRVIRSGRWLLASGMCRSAARMMGAPDYRGFHIGFRVASGGIPTP
ncbi:MAG: formylglycine-generating enzyme family protein [Candidatus Krumholzibacteriota bacterium]